MLEVIEKLLLLQERDSLIARLEAELRSVDPQRLALLAKAAAAKADLETGKLKVKHLETERKKLELEAQARRQLIDKYSLQQYQTKRNEEYRALTHEIDTCKAEIVKLEDQELEVMEQAETAQRRMHEAAQAAEAVKQEVDRHVNDLADRERTLRQSLAELIAGRDQVATAVELHALPRYERLRRSKGDRVVVGVDHGACGGCHMKLPAQVVLACRAEQELVICPNCGRILYFTSDMDMAVAD